MADAASEPWRNPIDVYAARVAAARHAEAELNAAVDEVRRFAPDFLLDPGSAEAARLLIDDSTALVSFCPTDLGTIAFVITRSGTGPSMRTVDIPGFTTAVLDDLLFANDNDNAIGWVAAAGTIATGLSTWLGVFDRVMAELADRLLAPVLNAVPDGIDRLVFLPAGGLFLLPLHAAPFGSAGRRIGDQYAVSYAPSATVLSMLNANRQRPATPNLYAAAVPNLSGRQTTPFAEWEAREIAKLFPDATVDIGSAADYAAVTAGVVGRLYIHFGCHGIYDPESPLSSGLELADGRLTLADLLDGRLNLSSVRLVTLSACESGIPDVQREGAEEYVGLPSGLLVAGVPCVVGTLWAVDDFPAALLMLQFYRAHLAGAASFADAMQNAQAWLRSAKAAEVAGYAESAYRTVASGSRSTLFHTWRYYKHLAELKPDTRPFSHPHYWAAFTVNGL